MHELPTFNVLYDSLMYEITRAMGLLRFRGGRLLATQFFGKAGRRIAQLSADLDRTIAEQGPAAGARWLLPNFVAGHEALGTENIPAEGPLVLACNHPAATDAILLSAHVSRPDYKIIIGRNAFFERLPHLAEHGIFSPPLDDLGGRVRVVRESIRHLQSGGALLIFPRGAIEPDPECMPDADGEFHIWSRSLEIFLLRVPHTRLLVSIVSGVIHPPYLRHPITFLRKSRDNRQRLAFMMQMARQVLSEREIFGLRPRVTFGELIQGSGEQALSKIQDAARRVLSQHMMWRT